jgi:arylsulfatase A-like enzyme
MRTLLSLLLSGVCILVSPLRAEKPNVIFIAIDDQNDWIGHVGGHPLAKTPNLDGLAGRGTTFVNAHCNAPLCNPSRTSLLIGLRPTTTGIYGLSPWFRTVPGLENRVSLPQHFAANGYQTLAVGKIFHTGSGGPGAGGKGKGQGKGQGARVPSPGEPVEFQVRGPNPGIGAKPPKKLIPPAPMGDHPAMDWGVWPPDNDDSKKGDYQVASWAVQQIEAAAPDQPFFLAAGFFLPHVPCYATQKWFDLYPDDDSILPIIQRNDRADTPRFSWYLHWSLPEPRLKWVEENGQWRNLVRSYLACTSFTDAQIGRILGAVKKKGIEDNTSSSSGGTTAGISARRRSRARTPSGIRGRRSR